jgi:hypothetical protein
MSKERYLIKVTGCVEPETFGPYGSESARSKDARKIHREMSEEDILFGLDMFPVETWAYRAGFFKDGK